MPVPLLTASATVWCAAPDATGRQASAWLSPDEARRAATFRHEDDRRRFVTGRALVRAALGERLDVPPADVAVVLGPRGGPSPGRPSVDGAPSFSIAHAGSWVLVAVVGTVHGGVHGGVDGTVHVGVDVESTATARDHLADLLDAVPPGERPPDGWDAVTFTRSWVRREAVLKAVGTGLLAPRDDLLLSSADRPAAVERSQGALPASDRLALADLDLPGGTPPAGRSAAGPSAVRREPDDGASSLAAVALCSPHHPVGLGGVALSDGSALLARHGAAARAVHDRP